MKIRNQLFFIFLSFGIVFVLLFSILSYYYGKKIILNEIYESLEALSQAKKLDLEEIKKLQLDKLNIVRTRVMLREQELIRQDKPYKKALDSIITDFNNTITDFEEIHIITIDGKIVNSTDSSITVDNKRNNFFKNVIHNKDFNRVLPIIINNNNLKFISAAPMLGPKNDTVAFVFIEFSPETLNNLMNDYTGLGKTGETMLLLALENTAINLPQTRFDKNAALKIKVPYKDPSYSFEQSLSEVEGIFEMRDYQNKIVMASIRKVPHSRWILITKIDKSEIDSRIYPLRNFLLLFNFAFVIVSFIGAYLLGKYLAKPIEELIVSTNKFREGDFHARVKTKYKNELGILSESFNSMADKLERKINDLDKVGYVISHDLKAPLNSIIPLTDFIKEENPNQELRGESYKMLDMIKEKSLQMKDLIIEILKTAKSEKMIKEHVDVDSLVSNIISNLSPPPNIQIYIQNNLPILYFHKVSLIQVFQNLLQNSIKFMNKEKGMIKVGFSENEKEYKFWVMDNGPGVKKKDQSRIFNMFEKSPITPKTESTGIGLAVVKKIITDNKGRIWIESKENEGFTAYFTLPKAT